MWAGLAIGLLLLLLSPKLLRYWARYRTRENLLQADIYAAVYSEAAAEAVPPNLRDALAAASADLILLGFEFVGFVTSQERGYPAARTLSVLRHRAERTFATVAFAIVERRGVAVEFETLFADEWWLRTVNRRAHFILAPHDTGRVDDPYVATLAEQWQSHREAAASEMSRERRDVDLHGYIRHKGAAQADEAASAVRYGFARRLETGEGFRITSLGAQVVLRRQADASRRVADALPMRGVLAMRCPPEDLEVKYSNILHAQNRPSRRPWAFLLSVLAFAVAALPFPNWSWFLWLIPFLLLHELGHWSTMRLFGHHDARIRFIPFLGAATLSTMQFRKLSHEVIVLLAGPVPGILLGLGLFQLADLDSDHLDRGQWRKPVAGASTRRWTDPARTCHGRSTQPRHCAEGGCGRELRCRSYCHERSDNGSIGSGGAPDHPARPACGAHGSPDPPEAWLRSEPLGAGTTAVHF
jgi:hypothetical protein